MNDSLLFYLLNFKIIRNFVNNSNPNSNISMKKLLVGTLTVLTSIMTSNTINAQERTSPFFEPYTAPYAAIPFDKIQNQDYEEGIIEGIKRQNQEIEAITNNSEAPTFENTIVAYERSGSLLYNVSITLGNLEHCLGEPELMEIVTKTTPMMTEHYTNIMLNEKLWKRIKAVYDTRNQRNDLTPEDLRLIEETYKSFAESGAMLEGADREKYRKLSAEISDLSVKFSQNLTNDMKNPARRLWLTADQLEGLPESVVAAAREEAKTTLEQEGKADDGSYLFTVFFPSYSPFMKYAKDRSLREKMHKLYNTRNFGGEFDNSQILKDIANIRLETANLFGKSNYSEYVLTGRMAKTPANVYNLLDQLLEAYYPAMQAELEEIENFARKTEGEDFKLEAWDYSYWSDKLKNEKYAFNDEDMRPYFEIDNTIDGVFGLAAKLLGYKFKENKNIPTYHKDVKAYEVTDAKGNIVGVLYTDFFYRPGKAPGAWMTEFRGEYRDENGNRVPPMISIVMNFTKPTGSEPALLTPYEVETFLHEFGHALHGLSANTTYLSLSGTNVYRDFVELFSQFNENYLTQKKFLDSFAKHYKTGKKMPQELIDKFITASQFGAGYACIRQLSFGYLDMYYHTITSPLRASADITVIENQVNEKVKMFDPVEGTCHTPAFGHIFSGGYASGYYGYKWAERLDADAFAAFQETGNIYDKKTAAKYLIMLSSGNTVDPQLLYETFRGKPATIDALLKRDGINK